MDLMLGFGAFLLMCFFVVVAVMPRRERWRAMVERDVAPLRKSGDGNAYLSGRTDPERFLRQLRLMAALAALATGGILIALMIGGG